MRKIIAILISVPLVLAGCNGSDKSAPAASGPAVSNNPSATAEAHPHPLGLNYPFKNIFASDSTFNHKQTGELRRAYVVEFSDGDITQRFNDVKGILVSKGYTPVGSEKTADGSVSQSFQGRGGAYLEARSDLGKSPKDPNSKGIIAMSWGIQSTDNPAPKN